MHWEPKVFRIGIWRQKENLKNVIWSMYGFCHVTSEKKTQWKKRIFLPLLGCMCVLDEKIVRIWWKPAISPITKNQTSFIFSKGGQTELHLAWLYELVKDQNIHTKYARTDLQLVWLWHIAEDFFFSFQFRHACWVKSHSFTKQKQFFFHLLTLFWFSNDLPVFLVLHNAD